jgi:uncharacterized damage-inducible protein DinB
MPGLLVTALIAHIDSSFEGPNGDYPSILEAITGLTAQQAAWRPSLQANSIWQIVDHLVASNEWQIAMLETGRADSPVWTVPGADDAAWQALVGRLKDSHARLKLSLERVSDEQLLENPTPESRRTLLELILSSGSAHEAHHGGQISYLRGLQEQK